MVGTHGFLQQWLFFLAINDVVRFWFEAIGSLAPGLNQALEAIGGAKVGEVASAIESLLIPFGFIQGLIIPLHVLMTSIIFIILIDLTPLSNERLLGHWLDSLTDLLVDR